MTLTKRPNTPEITETEIDQDVENLKEYKRTMNIVGRGSTHQRCSALDDIMENTLLYEAVCDIKLSYTE